MIKELVKDEEFLSVPCRAATAEDAAIAADLRDTLAAQGEAAALAANQIGEQVCIVAYLDSKERPRVMYNPRLKMFMRPYKNVEECLTRDEPAAVTRYEVITVAFEVLEEGQLKPKTQRFRGMEACAVQHMIDHCKGFYV